MLIEMFVLKLPFFDLKKIKRENGIKVLADTDKKLNSYHLVNNQTYWNENINRRGQFKKTGQKVNNQSSKIRTQKSVF